MKKSPINILVTINKNYINPLIVMLYSLIKNNSYKTNVYIMNKDLEKKDIDYIREKVNSDLITIIDIKIDDSKLANAPVSKQFPVTMYYRLFAHLYLPKNVNKVLYLDPDIIVDKDIMELYNLNINRFCYAGATHVKGIVKLFNDIRLGLSKKDPYINSGVLMINLNEIRKVKIKEKDIYKYISSNKYKLCLPDQDILSKLYIRRIKLIDAKDDLSVQVHPDDEYAMKFEGEPGKTEMWYVVDADPGSRLRSGFAKQVTPDEYEQSIANNTITDLLKEYDIHAGDVFFLPAGRVHSIGAGAFIAEIQQTSNITYRIYDFNRCDDNGNPRELHTEMSKAAIDYTVLPDYRTYYEAKKDAQVQLASCRYFTTSLYKLTKTHSIDIAGLDSFVILICTKGYGTVTDDRGNCVTIKQGESILVPATAALLEIVPGEEMELLSSWVQE
mgnify:CR=1 FL=1